MAVLLTVSRRLYQPGTVTHVLSVDPTAQGYKATFTRENWPAGAIATFTIDLTGPELSVRRIVQVEGGESIGRDGQVSLTSSITQTWPGVADVDNLGQPIRRVLVPTQLTLRIDILQTARTAITVESL